MPNIRIKDIPTTASATSSTDFIGIDGSANGTRKLNAYSPTFGGNLTVSGTGNSTFSGNLNLNGTDKSILLNGASTQFSREIDVRIAGDTEGRLLIRGGGSLLWGDGAGGFDSTLARTAANMLTITGGLTTSGNLTVSGTGTSSFSGPLSVTTAAGNSFVRIAAPSGQSPNVQFYKAGAAKMTLGYDLTGAVSRMQLYDDVGGAVRFHVAQSSGDTTVGGNLTVSGTGTSTFSGRVRTTSNDGFDAIVSSGNTGLGLGSGSQQYSLYLNAADNSLRIYSSPGGDRLAVSSNGNFLINTTIDGGQKLQVNGDIAVGTGNPFSLASTKFSFSSSTNYASMAISGGTGTGASIEIGDGSSRRAQIVGELDGSGTNGKMILRTFSSSAGNVATALTLDSSQNATFAGKVVTSSAIGATSADSSTTTIQAGASSGVNSKILVRDSWNGSNNNNAFFAVQLGDGSTTSDALRIDYQKNATFAGTALSTKATAFTSQTDLRNTVQFQASTTDAITRAGYLVRGATGNDDWYLLGDTQGGTPTFRIGKAASSTLTDLFTIDKNYGVIGTQGGTAYTPASASATGTAGQIAWDASYIYVCTAANTWKRVAIATW